MKSSTTLLLSLCVIILTSLVCNGQLSGQIFYNLNTASNQLNAFSFSNRQYNTTVVETLGGTHIIAVVQGNYDSYDNRYVVYLDSTEQLNVGYLNVETGNLTNVGTYQIPSYLIVDQLIPSSFGFDVVSQYLYCTVVFNTRVAVLTLDMNSIPSLDYTRVSTTATDATTGTFDPVSGTYFILTVVLNQYYVITYNTQTQMFDNTYPVSSQWPVYSEYQSAIVAYNGLSYIVQLVPPATSYVFQVNLIADKSSLTPLTSINLPSYYYNVNSATINGEFIFFVSSGLNIPNAILGAYQLNGFSTSTIQLPYDISSNDIVFVKN
ncbi:hypothetical protein CYY_003083 [Polysphondylium violaceum]|uniref:Carbohydrate binding domain-containing protein n=1 Tax=Polysphondylium violaceum TaxID=133409 RepID=A0A8J4V0G2_9MYCE|nr:hypothetical protein CYY_003083 [Polysphondylium violaceum]